MDEARAEALSGSIFTETVGGMGLLAVYIGHRLGLFKELANNGMLCHLFSVISCRTKLCASILLRNLPDMVIF